MLTRRIGTDQQEYLTIFNLRTPWLTVTASQGLNLISPFNLEPNPSMQEVSNLPELKKWVTVFDGFAHKSHYCTTNEKEYGANNHPS